MKYCLLFLMRKSDAIMNITLHSERKSVYISKNYWIAGLNYCDFSLTLSRNVSDPNFCYIFPRDNNYNQYWITGIKASSGSNIVQSRAVFPHENSRTVEFCVVYK